MFIMSSSTKLHLLLLLFSLPFILASRPSPTLPSPAPAPALSGITFVKHACNQKSFTETDIAFCVDILASDNRSLNVSNLVDLTIIACDRTLWNMSYTENYVMNIITYNQNIKLTPILEKVAEHYGPIKSDVNSVIHFAKDPKKKSFANRMAMNAKNEAVISVNEAKKLPGELAPPDVVSLHEYLVKLIVVIGMVTNDLH